MDHSSTSPPLFLQIARSVFDVHSGRRRSFPRPARILCVRACACACAARQAQGSGTTFMLHSASTSEGSFCRRFPLPLLNSHHTFIELYVIALLAYSTRQVVWCGHFNQCAKAARHPQIHFRARRETAADQRDRGKEAKSDGSGYEQKPPQTHPVGRPSTSSEIIS